MDTKAIREALAAATPEWCYNGNEIISRFNTRCGIGGFLKDEDNVLAVNAPTWLEQLLDENERLKKELAKVTDDKNLYQELFIKQQLESGEKNV